MGCDFFFLSACLNGKSEKDWYLPCDSEGLRERLTLCCRTLVLSAELVWDIFGRTVYLVVLCDASTPSCYSGFRFIFSCSAESHWSLMNSNYVKTSNKAGR